MDYSMIGPALALGLPALGSSIGCGIAGMASHGAMALVEEGHAKFIGLSAMPSSQAIYGFILSILMKNHVVAGDLSTLSGLFIGLFAGMALLVNSVYQGKVIATAIQATTKQPGIFGKCAAAAGIVESFALFTFVFSTLLL